MVRSFIASIVLIGTDKVACSFTRREAATVGDLLSVILGALSADGSERRGRSVHEDTERRLGGAERQKVLVNVRLGGRNGQSLRTDAHNRCRLAEPQQSPATEITHERSLRCSALAVAAHSAYEKRQHGVPEKSLQTYV